MFKNRIKNCKVECKITVKHYNRHFRNVYRIFFYYYLFIAMSGHIEFCAIMLVVTVRSTQQLSLQCRRSFGWESDDQQPLPGGHGCAPASGHRHRDFPLRLSDKRRKLCFTS